MNIEEFKIETSRLVIRPYVKEDYGNWLKEHKGRKPAQNSYDNGYKDMSSSTEEWFVKWISSFQVRASKDEMYILGVFRKDDGVHVGKIELFTLLRMDYQWAMMGYSILNQYWRNGYGIESVVAAIALFYEKLGFHRIELHINTDNDPSILLATKAGFQYECTRLAFSQENEEWEDFCIYYQNKENWENYNDKFNGHITKYKR